MADHPYSLASSSSGSMDPSLRRSHKRPHTASSTSAHNGAGFAQIPQMMVAYPLQQHQVPTFPPPSLVPPMRAQPSTRPHVSTHHPNAAANMDPVPGDPDAIFIRPPFTDFPDASKHPEGLTYLLLAQNPDWFLCDYDFQKTEGESLPTAIRYPPQLEPPRGWIPSSKKKEVPKDGWREGEEPRLRCSFCRRSYAGINAKSMWRRHILEKHRIAMINRRDNGDRPLGRGRKADKENDTAEAMMVEQDFTGPSASTRARRKCEPTLKKSKSMQETRTEPLSAPFLQTITDGVKPPATYVRAGEYLGYRDAESSFEVPPQSGTDEEDEGEMSIPIPEPSSDFGNGITFSSTPPLTPGVSPTKSSSGGHSMVLQSPYNPLATPSFRHSPARLPIDQPWRACNPTHEKIRDLPLAMLVTGEGSPGVSALDVSPICIVPASERGKRSVFSSPLSSFFTKDSLTDLDGPFGKLSPRRLFSDVTEDEQTVESRLSKPGWDMPFSPAFKSIFSPGLKAPFTPGLKLPFTPGQKRFQTPGRKNSAGELQDPIELAGSDDPFNIAYGNWVNLGESPVTKQNSSTPPLSTSFGPDSDSSSMSITTPSPNVLKSSVSSSASINSLTGSFAVMGGSTFGASCSVSKPPTFTTPRHTTRRASSGSRAFPSSGSSGKSSLFGPGVGTSGLLDQVMNGMARKRPRKHEDDDSEEAARAAAAAMGSPFRPAAKKAKRDFSLLANVDCELSQDHRSLSAVAHNAKRRRTFSGRD